MELIAEESRVRCLWGDRPESEEYLRRFPAQATALQTLLPDIDSQAAMAGRGQSDAVCPEASQQDTAELSTLRLKDAGEEMEGAGRRPAKGEAGGTLDGSLAGGLRRLGRYRVERLLGSGGFGQVFLAWDDDLQRQVAVKVATRELREEDADSYLAEARVVARLDHPHIVPVFDVGRTAEGQFYIVSKLIEGSDLASRIQEQRLTFLVSAMPANGRGLFSLA